MARGSNKHADVMQGLLGTKQTKPNSHSIIHIPKEVETAFSKYDRARFELEAFRQKNAALVEELDELRAKVEAGKEQVKITYGKHKEQLGSTFNGFSITRRRSIDASKLICLNPDALELVDLSITVALFDQLVDSGAISQEIADQVQTYTEVITAPRK